MKVDDLDVDIVELFAIAIKIFENIQATNIETRKLAADIPMPTSKIKRLGEQINLRQLTGIGTDELIDLINQRNSEIAMFKQEVGLSNEILYFLQNDIQKGYQGSFWKTAQYADWKDLSDLEELAVQEGVYWQDIDEGEDGEDYDDAD